MEKNLTPAQAKKLAIELLARAMVGDIAKLGRANYRSIHRNHGDEIGPRQRRQLIEGAVESAIDAYEPHRILMEEIGDKVVQRLFKLADAELARTTK